MTRTKKPKPPCPACNNNPVPDCEVCRKFVCATCKKVVSWDDGSGDDRPDDCSKCWWEWSRATTDATLDAAASKLVITRWRGETNGDFSERIKDRQRARKGRRNAS